MGVGIVYDSEKLVNRQHQIGGDFLYQRYAVGFLRKVEKQAYGIVDDTAVEVDYLR